MGTTTSDFKRNFHEYSMRAIRFIDRYILVPCLALFAIFTVITLCFLISDVTLRLGVNTPWPAEFISNIGLFFFGIDWGKATLDQKSTVFVNALSIMGALVAIWTIIYSVHSHRKHRKALEERQTVEVTPIHHAGIDDINKLAELLADAKKAIIFAGSFDWLLQGKLEEEIKRLANEKTLKLLSSKSRDEVIRSLNIQDPAIKSSIGEAILEGRNDNQIKLTMVEYRSGERACCTMAASKSGSLDGSLSNLVIYSENERGRVLLDIIGKLLPDDIW